MMASVALKEIAEINPKGPGKQELAPDQLLDFVPMADVSEDGSMQAAKRRAYSEVSKGFTAFRDRDVLLAKITPCFENNKIALARVSTPYAFGSTEFHVIRGKTKEILPEYLTHFLRQDCIRYAGERRMTGSAGQRRVPKAFLEELEIPLPSLDEQERIAAILDQADALRRLRQRAIDRLNILAQAIFNEMLEQDSSESVDLDCLCDVVRGSSPRPQGDPRYFGGPVPRLMIADITRDGMLVTPKIDSLTEAGAKKSRPMSAGSVVMAVSGAVGLPAILSVDACIHDGFVGFRDLDDRINARFFYQVLDAQRASNMAKGTGAIWKNLTTDQVKRFRIPVPEIAKQNEFLARIELVERCAVPIKQSAEEFEALFLSLQNRAFKGEL